MAKGTIRPTTKTAADETDRIMRPQRLGDAVYEDILQRLISMQISPDERVSVDDLVRKLGVSQTPIREALTRLEAQGLVVKTHLVGYRAAPQPTQEQFEQLYDTRFLIEPYAAAKAAVAISAGTLNELEELINRPARILNDHSINPTIQLARDDTEFHRTIAAASGNAVICGIMDTLQVRIQFFLLRRRGKPANPNQPLGEHKRILSALRKHDPNLAAEAMRDHLQKSRDRYWP